jgi:aminopeptidase
MVDSRLERLAAVLVEYGIQVKDGEWVQIRGDASSLPLIRQIHKAVIRSAGNPTLIIDDSYSVRTLLREGSEAQLRWLDPIYDLFAEKGNAIINILGTENTRANSNFDPQRNQIRQIARTGFNQTILQRTAANDFKWVLTQHPNHSSAQEANMSLEEYEDFFYKACFCDRDDPVAQWRRINHIQQQKVDWLKGKHTVRCKGPNVDLELSIANRVFVNASGRQNMPDGEIFTGPVEDSANGWIRFTYPSIVDGSAVSGIELVFANGRVVEASASQNEDLLHAQLNTDEGSRYLGELGIGTNFGIQQFTGNILFDEKIGGTIHLALGLSYPETGGRNQSAIHWDMICDMRDSSEIYVDDELFYRNGEFVI